MLAYRLKGRIGPGRTLTIHPPPDAPPGEYEIILLYSDPEAPTSAIEASNSGIRKDFDLRPDNKEAE